jgi:protein-tyrosine phosphatase
VERSGLADRFLIDSCGTGGGNGDWYRAGGWSYHEGDESDPRMTAAAAKRGISLTSRSRPLKPADLAAFDCVVGMDGKNIAAIRLAADHWRAGPQGQGIVPADYTTKLSLMTDYCTKHKAALVPDPYFGGPAGFEQVLDLLEDASQGLLAKLRAERGLH